MHICISIYISIILSVFIQESVFNTDTNKAHTDEFFFYYLPVYLLSARAMHIFCNDPLLPQGLSLTPRTLDICVIVFLLEFAQGVFCDWCPPKIHKYGKPRFGGSTLI